jgi:hypothetical protein
MKKVIVTKTGRVGPGIGEYGMVVGGAPVLINNESIRNAWTGCPIVTVRTEDIPDPPEPIQRIVFEYDGHRMLSPGDGYIHDDGTFDVRSSHSNPVKYDAYRRVESVTAEKETLKSCPCCGSRSAYRHRPSDFDFTVVCGGCGMSTGKWSTQEHADAAWNRRT